MINYQEEIKHFKPSLDVDSIEDEIAGMNLTDMSDLMMQLVGDAAGEARALKAEAEAERRRAARRVQAPARMDEDG